MPLASACESGAKLAPLKLTWYAPTEMPEGDTLQSQGYFRVMVNWAAPTEDGYAVLVARTDTTFIEGATVGAE